MRWPRCACLLLALSGTLAGCRSNSDLVEAELRTKDRDLHHMEEMLRQSKAYNRYLQQEVQQWQQAAAGPAAEGVVPVPTPVKSVQLGRQTGGLDEDGLPGDEALQVVIEPRDFDNHSLKATGTARIEALEITGEGVKKPLGQWTVPPDELRRHWRSGLLSTGFFVIVPWQVPPCTNKVRVLVQWVGPDGKPFEAERDVTVRLLPAALRKQADEVVPLMPKVIPPMPGADNLLPQPTPQAPPMMPPAEGKPAPEKAPLPPPAPAPQTLPLPKDEGGPVLPLPEPMTSGQWPRMAQVERRRPVVEILPPRR